MFIMHLVQTNGRLSRLMLENKNLLDKMHEGLVVVSEEERNLQFASKPAIKMLLQEEKEKNS